MFSSFGGSALRSTAEPTRSPMPYLSCGGFQQSAQPHDVVGRRREGKDPAHERAAAVAQFAQATDGFHPPKALLDEFPPLLADGIAGVPRRSRIDRAAAARRVLCQVWRDLHRAQSGDQVPRVIALV